ncbi:MAG: SOS response-associated peptidase [Deltaproteobacteria bacterium]|nr:SOS response-associated peptidase [Deltaproteobacteria bacterium]
MCGRMTLTRSAQEIAEFFAVEDVAAFTGPDGRPLRPRFNLAPSQPVLTVVAERGQARALAWKRWGLVPGWARDPAIGNKLFNARGETVDEKPSFRSAFKRRRCLVVADGFYEWTARNRGHRAHWIHPRADALLAFAGLYEHWSAEGEEPIDSATVITTEANPDVAPVHGRMPVVLARAAWATWLDGASDPAALKGLLVPAPAGILAARPVSRHVNDPRHDDPACLEAPPVLEAPGD